MNDNGQACDDEHTRLYGDIEDYIPRHFYVEQSLNRHKCPDAAWFQYLFNPQLRHFSREVYIPTAGRQWISESTFLSDWHLQKAIDGQLSVGWFSTERSRTVGIDVVDRIHGGWEHRLRRPVPSLLLNYKNVVGRFSVPPSLVVLYPRGLHLYYTSDRRPLLEAPPRSCSNEARRRVCRAEADTDHNASRPRQEMDSRCGIAHTSLRESDKTHRLGLDTRIHHRGAFRN